MTHQQVFASEHTSSWFGSIRILYIHTKIQTTSCHFLAQLYLGGSLVVCSKVFPKFTRKSCRSGGKTDCFWKFPVSLSVDPEKAKLMLEMDGEIIADLCGADSLPGGSFKDLCFHTLLGTMIHVFKWFGTFPPCWFWSSMKSGHPSSWK